MLLSPSCVEDSENRPITAILLQGYLPRVLVSGSLVELLTRDAEAAMPTAFVAISHVRSQGLGNENTNSLPLCQLSRLQNMVNGLSLPNSRRPIPFWIDTAFVPRTQPGNAIALEKLDSVFRGADAVLALDVSILSSEADTELATEGNFLKVKNSMWAKRLWTVREGALAKSLRVQFKDAAVDFDDVIDQYMAVKGDSLVSWTGTIANHNLQDFYMTKESNTAFIDLLLLFERDLRFPLSANRQMPPIHHSKRPNPL